MGKKALYGALMGLGEGISTYGGTLTTQATKEAEARLNFSRQASLEEIKQRFQLQSLFL